MKEIYRSKWFNLAGYLACTVKYDDGTRKTILQHQEVMEHKLGRKILPSELVHHIDENKRNNDPANLMIKSRSNHMNHHRKQTQYITITCIECGSSRRIEIKQERGRIRKKRNGPFCSKSCVGK